MTHNEFMDTAEKKMQEMLSFLHCSIADLVAQAYREGQRNVEPDLVLAIVREALNQMNTTSAEPESESKLESKTCESWRRIIIGPNEYEYECWGTPEMPRCNCGGDKSKCDFYGG